MLFSVLAVMSRDSTYCKRYTRASSAVKARGEQLVDEDQENLRGEARSSIGLEARDRIWSVGDPRVPAIPYHGSK